MAGASQVAFLKSSGNTMDNVGYIIPVPVVKTFLAQFEQQGRYVGMARLIPIALLRMLSLWDGMVFGGKGMC